MDGGHGELHVAMRDVRLAVVEPAAAQELLADGGKSPVAANNQVGLDLLQGPVGSEEHRRPATLQLPAALGLGCCVQMFVVVVCCWANSAG